jgi:hypothetical protein
MCMNEVFLIYLFAGMMVFNILASFMYLIGLDKMRASVRRAYSQYSKNPPP